MLIRRYTVLMLVLLLILSACGGDNNNEDNTGNDSPPADSPTSQPTAVFEVQHEDGVTLALPYADQSAEITVAPSVPEVFETSYQLTSDVYAIEADTEVFDTLVEITLPYDETSLPEGMTEEEVFAVFWYEGEWIRVDGIVDTENNTITVQSLHASYWSTAYDIFVTGLVTIGEFLDLYDDVENIPQNIEQARQLVEERRQRYGETIEAAEFTVEALDEISDIDNLIEASFDAAVHAGTEFALEAGEYVAIHHFGNVALGASFWVVKKGVQVVGIYNFVKGSWQLFQSAQMSGDTIGAMLRVETAYQELREAEAMLWAYEHPDARTMPPEFAEALARVNWKIREEVFEILEAAEPELVVTYQCSGDTQRTFTIENRGGPMAFPMLYEIRTISGYPLYGVYVRLDEGESDAATVDPNEGRAILEIDEYEVYVTSLCPRLGDDEVVETDTSDDMATVRLTYTDDYLILSQLSAVRPDISGLTFVGSNGESFAAIDWKDGTMLHNDIFAMRQHTCVQVTRSYDARLQRDFPDCRFTRGWVLSDSQFWRGDSFMVLNNGQEVTTCESPTRTCDMVLPMSEVDPATVAEPTDTNLDTLSDTWEGSGFEITGSCELMTRLSTASARIRITYKNGEVAMPAPSEYRIYYNDRLIDSQTFQLDTGELQLLSGNPNENDVVRVEVDLLPDDAEAGQTVASAEMPCVREDE